MTAKSGSVAPVLLAAILGVLAGLGLFTFGYARGSSYLTNDPKACANCHVMEEQFQSWTKSSHGKVAVCNDCHTPPGLIGKYSTKALNGFFHSLAFTTQQFPDQIQITGRNHRVAEKSCLKCHEQVVDQIRGTRPHGHDVSCIQCHSRVGHM
ncbi:MAG: cytochrome c nitrite reductase small subunit [Bryobacteraceae bacterium]|nr:cytochrome c nitrite reductase small subunit [Bryobacteraceae bacterium]